MPDMKLGLSLGYWASNPPTQHVQMAQQAEQLGYDSVWTAEAYVNTLTPLAWIGAQTERIRLGTEFVRFPRAHQLPWPWLH